MKIRLVGAEFFHAAERTQTEMTKVIVFFSNFAKKPKNANGVE
jgi:hypothetical protein